MIGNSVLGLVKTRPIEIGNPERSELFGTAVHVGYIRNPDRLRICAVAEWLATENVDVAQFHLRVVDGVDVLNAQVAADQRESTVELDAAWHLRIDSQREQAQCVVMKCAASPHFRRLVADAYLKRVQHAYTQTTFVL